MLFEKLQAEMKDAMKAYDNMKRDCLRSVLSEIKNATVNAGKELTDDVCMKVLQKAAKQREDSIKCFILGNREDLAEKEKAELEILKSYLPKMMSEAEMREAIDIIISEQGTALSKKSFGIIMKQLPKDVDKRAASSYLNSILK